MKPIKVLNIESPDNALFKELLRTHDTAGVKKTGLFMVAGQKLVAEALELNNINWSYLVLPSEDVPFSTLPTEIKVSAFSPKLFQALDIFGTHHPLLFGHTPKLKEQKFSELPAPKGMEVVLPLSDPQNLGTAIRTCHALGVSQIYLTKESAHPFHPKTVRASSGTVLSAEITRLEALNEFIADTTNAYALDMDGEDILRFEFPKNFRLILGEEGQGVPKSFAGQRLSIPMREGVESLNAVSALTAALTLALKAP